MIFFVKESPQKMRGAGMNKMRNMNEQHLRAKLDDIRKKINVGQDSEIHKNLMEHIGGLSFTYGSLEDDRVEIPNTIGRPYKIKMTYSAVPEKLKGIIEICKVDRQIPMNEVSSIVVAIYPPPKEESSYVNIIEPGLMTVRDRFIYFAGSDENVTYKLADASNISSYFGRSINTSNLMQFEDHVTRGYLNYIDQTNIATMNVIYDDTNTIEIYTRNGKGFRPKFLKKFPLWRYVIVIDFIMLSHLFKEKMTKVIDSVEEIAETKANKPKGLMAAQMLSKIAKQTAGGENQIEDGEKIPDLIEYNPETGEVISTITGSDSSSSSSSTQEDKNIDDLADNF